LREHDQPVYGLQATGLDGEMAPLQSVSAIAAANIAALLAAQPRGPFHLSGHSFGSHIAFEMAQQLLRGGHAVARVIILDTPAPSTEAPVEVPSLTGTAWILQIAGVLERLYRRDLKLAGAGLEALDWNAQLACLNEAMKTAGIVPLTSEVKEIRGLVEVYRAQAEMVYRPVDVVPVRLALLRAAAAEAGPTRPEHASPGLGWERYCEGPMLVGTAPGDHLTMMMAPNVETLAERISLLQPGTV
jgi:thioesterase domain-containing protein